MTTAAPFPPEAPAKPRTSRMAITSLVLGIVGPCTIGLGSLVGIILGIVGLLKIKKSAGQLGGSKVAIAGIVVSGLGILLLPFIGIAVAVLMPAIAGARSQANAMADANNVNQLCKMVLVYAMANRDKAPPAEDWPQVLTQQGLPESVLADPADPAAGRAYAINALVAGKSLTVARVSSRTVLFFECAHGSPTAGGPELLPPQPRHGRGYTIGFCDGHVESVSPQEVDRLIWDPTQERPNK